MIITRYIKTYAREWDDFVANSRNGTFLFMRGYMDYHADRFKDHSLMYFDNNERLIGVMPANEKDGVLYSHQGLTYGGFVLAPKVHAVDVAEMMRLTVDYLREQGFERMVYKQVPHIYHRLPSEEEEYWLWRMGAEFSEVNISSTVAYPEGVEMLGMDKRRRRYLNKLERDGVRLQFGASLAELWPIVEANLMARHGVKPVHTLEEMELLQSRFPENIECVTAVNAEGEMLAGAVNYLMDRVVHVQYGTASPLGRELAALNYLYISLIRHYGELSKYAYFDFGISNEEHGRVLNESLIHFKEGFGARGVAYKIWSLDLTKTVL